MEMETYKIISERLKKLREQFGYSQAKVAEGAKICLASVSKSETGSPIGIESIKALANFYGVSIDYICGVTDEINVTDRAKFIKKYSYERYLVKCNRDDDTKKPILGTYCPVWPYNLLDELISDTWSKPLSNDQMDGLNYAIESLSDREKYCVKAYFLEEKSMKDIACNYDVTYERVRQIIHKALRKLRSPDRFKYIRYGFEGYWIVDQTRKEELRRKHLQVLILQNERMEKKLDISEENDEEMEKLLSISILELNLSVRSYNCLYRWKYMGGPEIKTQYDLTRITGQELMNCRNLGMKSFKEIEAKLAEYGLKFKEENHNE